MIQSQWFARVGEANIQMFRLANCWCHIYDSKCLLLVVFGNGEIWSKMYDLLNEKASEEATKKASEEATKKASEEANEKANEDACEKAIEEANKRASEDACEEFKESERKECKMTCLAGTIIALIAITSLLLPSLEQAHWVARALWVFSLLASCFSAHYACNLRRVLSKLQKCDVRNWMMDSSRSGITCRFPCVLAVLMISCPKQLLHYALPAYIVGLGVYLGSLWCYPLDTAARHNDSRNIFIVFLVSALFCYLYSQFAKMKDVGRRKRKIDSYMQSWLCSQRQDTKTEEQNSPSPPSPPSAPGEV